MANMAKNVIKKITPLKKTTLVYIHIYISFIIKDIKKKKKNYFKFRSVSL